ncbi:glycosyl hydrolase family 61 domain-containing protein [Sarocladium implicatum]|nr:glycosyl hydrolase family 61 domain-containing protein [Sarocladium implicatum]
MKVIASLSLLPWLVPLVKCHSHVANLVLNGGSYEGFDPRGTNADILTAWSTQVEEDGWVGVNDYNTSDIICHVNATNSLGYASVAGGDKISWQWAGWPESHKGPVLTYMARCGTDGQSCAEQDMASLEFFETGRAGLLDPDRRATDHSVAMGYWATDLLIERNYTWLVEVPKIIEPGFYIMRHELIALHYALVPGQGPQHYPQCVTLEVSGSGTARPEGILGTELYKSDDAGLAYDIFEEELALPYEIPGPTLISGVAETVTQSASFITDHVEATPILE